MRLVFLGTPAASVPPLRALHAAGHEVALVVTQPDRKRGRGGALAPSPVRAAAEELGLSVLTPERATDAADAVRASGATLGVVVAFGQLLRPAFLAAVPDGFVNVHFSLLPRWRGAAPVERAVLAGDAETGVCIMAVDETLDTGAIYARARTPIGAEETAGELRDRLVLLGAELLVRTLPSVPTTAPVPQRGEPTYAEKLTVAEFRLDPSRPVAELARVVRAGNPRPGAWVEVGGRRVRVLRAAVAEGEGRPGSIRYPGAQLGAADGLLHLREVQVEGKRPMAGDAWLAGFGRKQLTLEIE